MPVSRLSVPATYADLKKAVEAVVFKGRQQIELAWVRTYHETGRLINEHILQNRQRAGYGAGVFEKLSADTGISKRTLQECAQFQRCFPIPRTCAQLGWAHYRTLCQVADQNARTSLMRDAIKHEWTVAKLVQRVRPLNAALEVEQDDSSSPTRAAPQKLLTLKRGTPGIFRLVSRGDALAVDLGFRLYLRLSDEQAEEFSAGDFVTCDARGRVAKASEATKADLFTYSAVVRRTIDGDTLAISLQLPGRYEIEQKLRLRGVDCPEMDTAAGKAAKRFAESLVAAATAVTIYTTKPDKYDRYLADVFLAPRDAAEVFLNNAILAAGHAVRMDEYRLEDWEG
ncbi:MAG: DUF1016 N-terminal domain-containing protein [Candidatus Didemnitutus sp.]|nr:DUF1016 N-terminal domain-containing protein [Candidatus Didemnitutus sp.]